MLLATIRAYIQKLTYTSGEQAAALAVEVLQETAVEALAHAERYLPTRQPRAWLLGIAMNVIKRKMADEARRQHHEVSLSTLESAYAASPGEEDLLDHLTRSPARGLEDEVEAEELVQAMLALVPAEDQVVLRLALLEEVQTAVLAQRLGTTLGTARMRLHRALRRLRAAWYEHAEGAGND